MTLILTAICKDDIFVCADTRYEDKKWSGGYKDGFDKIYKFDSYPLIIFNHGVNQFNERYWDSFCLEYEKLGGWKGKNLDLISEDFRSFIEGNVLRQLDFNMKTWPNDVNGRKSGFVVCGKNSEKNELEIYEYFWNPKPEPPQNFPWKGVRLNGFGTGYDNYLKNDVSNFIDWKAFNQTQIKRELEKLFSLARERKNSKGGKEFSDNCIVKSIMQ